MKIKKLFTQIFFAYVLLVIFSIVMLAVYEQNVQKNFYRREIKADLTARARLIALALRHRGNWQNKAVLDSLLRVLSRNGKVRITLILRDGKVLSDSHKDANLMDNHADRPEVKQAFAGKIGYAMRHSYTLNTELVYLALPLKSDHRVQAVVRVAFPYANYRSALKNLQWHFFLGGLIVVLLTALLSYLISRRISRPLETIRQGAQRFAQGNFTPYLREQGTEEIRAVVRALNSMARELDYRIRTISLQRYEQEAMFSSMKEGILAVDSQERILRINQAARKFFHIQEEDILKRPVYEVIRHNEVLEFIRRILRTAGHLEKEITVMGTKERILLFNGAPLRDARGKIIGSLIVMYNITRIKRLDKMRQEFVANVSHELKTPITSLKGYVETLREGDVDAETRERFLEVIARQTERMNAIIDDLLQLSRLEHGGKKFERKRQPLLPVVREAVQSCKKQAEKKDIVLRIVQQDEVSANVNAQLLRQAILNLLDNAIKYSPAGKTVRIFLRRNAGQVEIGVQDEGIGIEKKYHARLFERFYRVDKARSREMGGTGLGLSIVKHIVLLHGGRVTVESEPDKGSTFTIILPQTETVPDPSTKNS